MKLTKQLISIFLTVILLLGMVPANAYATLSDNTVDENQKIIDELSDVLGSEDDAREYYDVLEKYGLIDEKGNPVDSWKITMDGKSVSLDKIRKILQDDYDPEKIVWVDDMPVTLEKLNSIITIEDYISYLGDNLISADEMNEEQSAGFKSLLSALENDEVDTKKATDPNLHGDFSGVNHGAVVDVDVSEDENNYIFTVKLSAADKGQKVSFDYSIISGSAVVSEKKDSVNMTADEDGTASESFSVKKPDLTTDDVISDTETAFFVMLSDLKNALFTETASDSYTLAVKADRTVGDDKEVTELVSSISLKFEPNIGRRIEEYTLSDNEKFAIKNKIINTLRIPQWTYDNFKDALNDDNFDYADVLAEVYACTNDYSQEESIAEIHSEFSCEPIYDYKDGRFLYYEVISRGIIDNNEFKLPKDFVPDYISYGGFSEIDNRSFSYPLNYNFVNTGAPEIVSISVPAGEFYSGQQIPVTLKYSEPVKVSSAKITVNDEILLPVEDEGSDDDSASNSLTFLYTVKKADALNLVVSDIVAADIGDNKTNVSEKQIIEGTSLKSCLRKSAFTTLEAEYNDNDAANPVLDVTLGITDNEDLTAWLISELGEDGVCESITAAVSDCETKTPFVFKGENLNDGTFSAAVPLEVSEEEKVYTVEIYDGDNLIYEFFTSVKSEPSVYVTQDDISTDVIVKNSDGGVYEYENDENIIYPQDAPIIKAYFSLADKKFIYGDVTSVTTMENGIPVDGNAQFAWESSDPTVAKINADGTVVPTGKAGTVHFILTALNGGDKDKIVSTDTEAITFGVGYTPFLLIPNKNITVTVGNDVPVYWTSNLADKDSNVKYNVSVSSGSDVIYSADVSESGIIIFRNVFSYDYSGTVSNTYKVNVSAVYNETEYKDETQITLVSKPAKITLSQPETNYVLDTDGNFDISWSIENFDLWSKGDSELYRLLITKNNETVYETNDDPGSSSVPGEYTGHYSLKLSDVKSDKSVSTSYRDVYTVTIEAKNGYDSTWSYDSFVFYVYDADALKLWIDGEEAGDKYTMSNIPAISSMTQSEILALKRDIAIKNLISSNYGEFAWNELSDKLSWKSSDSDTVSVNYRQGTEYADIEDYTYTSYRPATEFMLSGVKDGSAEITATHVLTGMKAGVNVDVKTLKDKLYLFSCVPAVTTKLTYTNGNGETKTVVSEINGEAAVYEESGIASDVYFTSSKSGVDYNGTFKKAKLCSGEGNATQYELYPCNNIKLRQTAYYYLYLKNSDGTAYTDDVKIRAGVYVNDEYCQNALFAFKEDSPVTKHGDTDNVVTPSVNGKISVVMDNSQWNLDGGMPGPNDKISYYFFITPAEGEMYRPLVVKADTKSNGDEYVASGNSIAKFVDSENNVSEPYIFSVTQRVQYEKDGSVTETDLTDYNGSIGISKDIKQVSLDFDTLWWGVDEVPSAKLFMLSDYRQLKLDMETEQFVYPFAEEYVFSHSSVIIDRDNVDYLAQDGEKTNLSVIFSNDGTTETATEKIDFGFINMQNVSIGDGDNFEDMSEYMESYLNVDGSAASDIEPGDSVVKWFLKTFASDKFSDENSGMIKFNAYATHDPSKFVCYFTAGLGTMVDGYNATGVYADSKTDSTVMPWFGFRELKLLFTRNTAAYSKSLSQELDDAKSFKGRIDFDYIVRGNVTTVFSYNSETGEWECDVISGGFDAGFGLTYAKVFNGLIGPIPITTEVKVGLSAKVSMQALTCEYLNKTRDISANATEFLTKFRVFAYLKLFGGLGFDYSVVALKIGAFGQINLDLNFHWLNRPYLSDNAGDDIELAADSEAQTNDANLAGQNVGINGKAGVEFYVKLWLVSYEKIIAAKPFQLMDTPYNDWKTIQSLWQKNMDHYHEAVEGLIKDGSLKVSQAGDAQMYELALAPTLEDFSYLEDDALRIWNSSSFRSLMKSGSGNSDNAPVLLQSNAYPFSQPVLSDYGEILVYASDDTDNNSTVVRTSYALKTKNGYENMGVIEDGGFGDSTHTVAGTKDFAVAAWTRTQQDIKKDEGSVVTGTDRLIISDSSDIFASVFTDGKWSSVKLSDDMTADTSPVVAVNGDRAVVLWRNVATSNIEGNMADFNLADFILYRIYENGQWSETRTLYNGTSGNVKGLVTASLSDGTTAAAYIIDTDGTDSTYTDRELVYSVIAPDGSVTRTVRATTDDCLDENPQIAAVKFSDGSEKFVVARYSVTIDEEGNTENDIRLIDFDNEGIVCGVVPQSMSKVTEGIDITSDFIFSKNSETIDDLSIVWVERRSTDDSENPVDYDALSAVKFYSLGENGDVVGATGKFDVTEMAPGTLIDSYDSISSAETSNRLTTVILGTSYGVDGETVEKTGETVSGEIVTYEVPKSQSDMYTRIFDFGSGIDISVVYTDPSSLKCGTRTSVIFTLENTGVDVVNEAVVNLAGEATTFSSLNLIPGDSVNLTVDYRVPADTVINPDYTVTAKTDNTTVKHSGTGYFAYTDIKIADAKIVDANAGVRTIETVVVNTSDTKLENSGKQVRIKFFKDATCTEEIENMKPVIISDNSSLKMIDEGGFCVQSKFDLKDIISDENGDVFEIPEAGIPVYVQAEVLGLNPDTDEYEPIAEYNKYDNTSKVVCNSLSKDFGEEISVETAVKSDGKNTVADISVFNNNMAPLEKDVIVTLYDENDNVVAVKSGYDKQSENKGIVKLDGETGLIKQFVFDEVGSRIEVTFVDFDEASYTDASLSALTFKEIPELNVLSFVQSSDDETVFTAAVSAEDIENLTIEAVTNTEGAVVAVNGGAPGNTTVIKAEPGKNTVDITVTAKDGETTRHYILELENITGAKLEKIKEAAVGEIESLLTENSTDEEKALVQEAVDSIMSATSEDEVESIKKSFYQKWNALHKQDDELCKNPVTGFCFTYNRFIHVPFIGTIFKFVHEIIHIFHGFN